jgi:hypothetical protein
VTPHPSAKNQSGHGLEVLRPDERYAARALEIVTGATATAHDINGRQGAVDVILTYPSGRFGALEVTTVGNGQEFQRDSLLARDNYAWPNPGNWAWTVSVADARDIPRLKQMLGRVIPRLEAAMATCPEALSFEVIRADPDLWWLYVESGSDIVGHPSVPSFVDGDGNRYLSAVPAGGGGGVDTELASLPKAADDILSRPRIVDHVRKLLAVEAEERHLFIRVGETGVPIGLYLGMMKPEGLPPDAAHLPVGITDLWLKLWWGPILIHWSTSNGWQLHQLPAD